jgi:hypothetical protein
MAAIEEFEAKLSNRFKDKLYNRMFICLMVATLFFVNIWNYSQDKKDESDTLHNVLIPYQEIITAGLVNNLQKIFAATHCEFMI